MNVHIDNNEVGIVFERLDIGDVFVWNDKAYVKVSHSSLQNAVCIGGGKQSTFSRKTKVLDVTTVHVIV